MIGGLMETLTLAAGAQPSVGQGASFVVDKLTYLVPELILFGATCVVMMLGLSRSAAVRNGAAAFSIVGLAAAGIAAAFGPAGVEGSMLPSIMPFSKMMIAAVGILLVLTLAGTVDRDFEDRVSKGYPFDPIRSNRGEFYAFVLFSLTGLMLVASADDLIWLFLALELTSLPTYVMVSISTPRSRAQEAGVKYFFLGAFGAATFLMGFTLLYGAAGTTQLFGEVSIASQLAAQQASGGLSPIAVAGLVLSVIGVGFKIAAVPMHFYTADVYQGAATPVSAFLAFVPKTAGFLTLMLLLAAVGWGAGSPDGVAGDVMMRGGHLPEEVRVTLWVIAALTMTVGNVLAVLQSSIKRMLAYSSIAHSGYMLVGLIAGPGDTLPTNGLGAVMFYLLAYGVMNLGAFAVIASLEKRSGGDRAPEEIDHIDAIRGLARTNPVLGWTMVLSAASLMGLPVLLGFFGKLYLFFAALSAGEVILVIVLAINSAIAAFYYLRLMFYPLTESRDEDASAGVVSSPFPTRTIAGLASALAVIALVPFVQSLTRAAHEATAYDTAEVTRAAQAAVDERELARVEAVEGR